MNSIDTDTNNKGNKYQKFENSGKNDIGLTRHMPTADSLTINNAVERATKDKKFLNNALESIKPIKFPTYKSEILSYLKKATNINDNDIISLFESLDGYMRYEDLDHIRTAIEENVPGKKIEHQISDDTRENLDVRTRETNTKESVKIREAVSIEEERKDYPEVTPTAMRSLICDMCGKEFQSRPDLVQHRRFESGL